MKKVWVVFGLLGFMVLGLGLAILNSFEAGQTNQSISRTWNLAEGIKSIELYGTQQPVRLLIETGADQFSLTVEGRVPDESLETLEQDSQLTQNKLYLPFARHGFKLAVSQSGKTELLIRLSLSADTTLEDLSLDTWTGDVTVEVPADFSARYELDAHQSGEVASTVKNDLSSSAMVTISTYGEIRIEEKK